MPANWPSLCPTRSDAWSPWGAPLQVRRSLPMHGGLTNGRVASRSIKHRRISQDRSWNPLPFLRPQSTAVLTAFALGKVASNKAGWFLKASKYTAATVEWGSIHSLSMPCRIGSPNLSRTGSLSAGTVGRSWSFRPSAQATTILMTTQVLKRQRKWNNCHAI